MKNSTPNKSRYGFEKFFKDNGKYYFQFNNTNDSTILFSQGYKSEQSRMNGIRAVIRAKGKAEQYELKQNKDGKFYFILKALGNRKEIGRSTLFDTQETIEEAMDFLRNCGQNIPIFDMEELLDKKETSKAQARSKPKVEKTTKQVPKKSAKPTQESIPREKVVVSKENPLDSSGKMPRYKCSIIYYPDSKIWSIKNDFTGASKQLKVCDGQEIEAFLLAQLPEEERTSLVKKQPKLKPRKRTNLPKIKQLEQAKMALRNHEGQLEQRALSLNNLRQVEVIPQSDKELLTSFFTAKVIARSLEDNSSVLISTINYLKPEKDRFIIPIQFTSTLKPGLYVLRSDIQQEVQAGTDLIYHASQLIELN